MNPLTNQLDERGFRGSSHAGSWYTSNAPQLTDDLSGWLSSVHSRREGEQFPVPGCKAIIAPHAGYSFSGATAAWAYKSIDPSTTRRIFILGPSHHWSINNCALPECHTYLGPIGSLPVDTAVVQSLYSTGLFRWMNKTRDEAEHSIEMQLPFLRRACEGKDITIVPILVGNISKDQELEYGRILAPYLAEEGTVFIASSDFCHWGQYFDYTFYRPSAECPLSEGFQATRATPQERDFKFWQSITQLDQIGMGILADQDRSALIAHRDFHKYLADTGNTICGRHAIGVLYGALADLEEKTARRKYCRWVKYDQSNQVTRITEQSVSYASAWITI